MSKSDEKSDGSQTSEDDEQKLELIF